MRWLAVILLLWTLTSVLLGAWWAAIQRARQDLDASAAAFVRAMHRERAARALAAQPISQGGQDVVEALARANPGMWS